MENQIFCEICNTSVMKYYSKNDIDLFKCPNCYFIFADRHAEINFNYQTDFYVNIAERANAVHEFYAEARFKLIKKYKPYIESILDVGCGSGIFLTKINSDVRQSKGIDISEKAVKQAKRKGLNVELKSVFEEYDKYDVITLIEVVEHLQDLNALFDKLYNLLNKDGIIYFQTGNTSSFQFFLKRKKWHYFDPPAHCSYLGKKNIRTLLKNHNFKILYIGSGVDLRSYLMTNNKPYNFFSVLKAIIGKIQFNGFTIPSTFGVIAKRIS